MSVMQKVTIEALRAEATTFVEQPDSFAPAAATDLVRRLAKALERSVDLIDTEAGRHALAERDLREKDVTTVWLAVSGWLLLREVPEAIDYQLRELRERLVGLIMTNGRRAGRAHGGNDG